VLTNFDHDRQWFITLIPPSHESAAVTVDFISRLSGLVRLALRYTVAVTVSVALKDLAASAKTDRSSDSEF